MTSESIRRYIFQFCSGKAGVRIQEVPGTDLVCVFKKLDWGEHLPQRMVYLAPVAIEPSFVWDVDVR